MGQVPLPLAVLGGMVVGALVYIWRKRPVYYEVIAVSLWVALVTVLQSVQMYNPSSSCSSVCSPALTA